MGAMYQKRGSDRLVVPEAVVRDVALEQALASDAIQIAFQPQIDPCTGVGGRGAGAWSGAESPSNCSRDRSVG